MWRLQYFPILFKIYTKLLGKLILFGLKYQYLDDNYTLGMLWRFSSNFCRYEDWMDQRRIISQHSCCDQISLISVTKLDYTQLKIRSVSGCPGPAQHMKAVARRVSAAALFEKFFGLRIPLQ